MQYAKCVFPDFQIIQMVYTILEEIKYGLKENQELCQRKIQNFKERKNLQEFNVVSTEWGICVSSEPIDEKSNEIPKMQEVLKEMDCRGCIVTADAMNTQKEITRAIIEDTHGDYCLALKGNQKTAYQEVKEYFSCGELLDEIRKKDYGYRKETEETNKELLTREYYITEDIKWFADRKEWKKLNTIGYERKTILQKESGDIKTEERYYLCSIKPDAELFSIAVHRHWHVENCLHWTLDVVFQEDKLRSKEKNAIHNLGLIRRFVMFILKLMKSYYNRSMRSIRKKIGRKKAKFVRSTFAPDFYL